MKKFILLFAVLFSVLLLALPAYATDITVSSDCSLADAITAANKDEAVGGCSAGDGADVITLSENIALSRALPLITSEMTIEGADYTIQGKDHFHIIGVHSRGNLTLNEVTITNGRSFWGGAIGNFGILTITNSIIRDNSADEGGAIGNEGTLTIRNSSISNNRSQQYGGAIHIEDGTLTISSSSFSDNWAASAGGAIYNLGSITVTDSSFNNNSIGIPIGTLGGTFGGAIHIEDGTLTISSSSFSGNSARSAGAIHNKGELSISNSSFSGNSARYAGAIYNKGELSISNSSFSDNWAGEQGGAILNRLRALSIGNGTLSISNSSFSGNSADINGGAINSYNGTLSISNSTFNDNSAGKDGGAIDSHDRTSSISNSTFHGNSAGEDGGSVYIRDSDRKFYLYNSILAGGQRGDDCFGRLAENISNLIEDGSCFAELIGDPMLGELVRPEDGSPAYYPLLEGSPAIDAADAEHCTETDQIGTARPQGVGCDIGAIEYTPNQ